MKLVFFSRPKNRKFDYKPLYYDQEKEAREQRKRELGLESGEKDHRSFYRGELQRNWRSNKATYDKSKRPRTMMYFILVLVSIYFIFFTDIVQNFVNSLITN